MVAKRAGETRLRSSVSFFWGPWTLVVEVDVGLVRKRAASLGVFGTCAFHRIKSGTWKRERGERAAGGGFLPGSWEPPPVQGQRVSFRAVS